MKIKQTCNVSAFNMVRLAAHVLERRDICCFLSENFLFLLPAFDKLFDCGFV